ncbi:glycosyltransferase [Acinetobacter sp. MN12]|uniref:glycosyltransferase family protein n=1 Tax=Acinetobacter sp. MN12 TaxID=1513354 RepID=UPI00067C525E|nr:glycosyltransferase [Acinetobacter sp. MN12]
MRKKESLRTRRVGLKQNTGEQKLDDQVILSSEHQDDTKTNVLNVTENLEKLQTEENRLNNKTQSRLVQNDSNEVALFKVLEQLEAINKKQEALEKLFKKTLTDQNNSSNKNDNLIFNDIEKINKNLETVINKVHSLEGLKNESLKIQERYLTQIDGNLNAIKSSFSNELKDISSNVQNIRDFINKVLFSFGQKVDNLVSNTQDIKIERTISYQLGKMLIDSKKNVVQLLKLPIALRTLRQENLNRKEVKKEILVKPVKTSIENAEIKTEVEKTLKSTTISVGKQHPDALNKKFSKGLTLLDPISELCWQDGFPGFAISRKQFEAQISSTTSDFAFFESAWKANKSQWLYAFNSPNLQHNNAQDLLKVIGLLRAKKLPVIFWNKEDPMHYEMFMPIAKEADYVFTTDSLKVEQYKKDLGHSNVWSLPFAAPIKITNPINRFSLDTETVCFAGTYYAKNHPDRKKQMDMLLPTLLKFSGAIYDRASNTTSENYQYPEVYHNVIREGVEFDEMTQLYKKFKVFLNVNTITQSPTMMSRRVYELLASGTPVVSTPSKAITEQFPGIVLTVRNEEEAKIAVEKLLTDSYFWNKQSVLGIREVMSNHTYEDRWLDIKAKMQGKEQVNVSKSSLRVVAIYHGYQDINFFIRNILDQSQEISELVILKSSKLKVLIEDGLSGKVEIFIQNTTEFNVNAYVKKDVGGYTFFTTDNVIIFKNCIKDMLLSFKYHNGYAVARKVTYNMNSILANNDLSLSDPSWFSFINSGNLNCLLVHNKSKDKIVIDVNNNKTKILDSEQKIYLIDPFNVAAIDKRPVSNPSVKKHEKFKYAFEPNLGI